jgi:hypothetical protein
LTLPLALAQRVLHIFAFRVATPVTSSGNALGMTRVTWTGVGTSFERVSTFLGFGRILPIKTTAKAMVSMMTRSHLDLVLLNLYPSLFGCSPGIFSLADH